MVTTVPSKRIAEYFNQFGAQIVALVRGSRKVDCKTQRELSTKWQRQSSIHQHRVACGRSHSLEQQQIISGVPATAFDDLGGFGFSASNLISSNATSGPLL